MRRSQLQPVMNAAAAGGKRMATWRTAGQLHCPRSIWVEARSDPANARAPEDAQKTTHDDEENVRATSHCEDGSRKRKSWVCGEEWWRADIEAGADAVPPGPEGTGRHRAARHLRPLKRRSVQPMTRVVVY